MTEYEIEIHRLERMLLFFVLVFVYELKIAKHSIFLVKEANPYINFVNFFFILNR
jgi:hypothetical protein